MADFIDKRYPQPVRALGNPEDERETDPDALRTSAMSLWRGILFSLQGLVTGTAAPNKVDDTAFTPATSSLTVVGGLADETAPAAVTEGRAGAARVTLARAWHVNLRDASGNVLALGAGAAGTTTLRTISADDDLVAASTRLGNTAASSGHRHMVIGAFRDDVGATTVAEGNYSAFRVDAWRALHVTLQGNQVTLLNISGTITSGGVAQQIAAAKADRRGFFVQNLSTGDLWINSMATAVASQPSIKIPPNALYECPETSVPTTALSIIGATTGQAFTAREW